MRQCSHCEGFVPAKTADCPHCEAQIGIEVPKRRAFGGWRLGKKLTAAAGAGAMMFTMMACYGSPPCQSEDKDKDGFSVCVGGGFGLNGPEDCDDNNAAINPEATDPKGDGVDQNCDGVDGDANASTNTGTP